MSTSSHPFKFGLPQELIDKVVDKADFQSLKTLGLVSKQWCPRTRELLFKGIKLSEELDHPLDPTTRCERLLELLEAKSELRRLPRTLLIRSSTYEDKDKDLGWLQVCSDDVIKILGMLQNVSVVCLQQGAMQMNFSHLPSPLRAALHSFISRRNVVELTLLGVECIEMTPLVQHRSLRRLSLSFSRPPRAELGAFFPLNLGRKRRPTTNRASLSSREDSALSRTILRELDVSGAGYALFLLAAASQDPQATLDLTQIKVLRVGTMGFGRTMTLVWPYFLQTFCQNVSHYSVALGPARPRDPEDIQDGLPSFNPSILCLARLPSLKCLHVEVPHYYLGVPRLSLLPYLLEALRSLSSSRKPVPLEVLDVKVDFENLDPKSEPEDVTQILTALSKCQELWGRLDEILSNRQVFSQLITLVVRMGLDTRCTFTQSDEELDELKNDMRSYMPNLVEQSKVEVIFRIPAQ
ncbi:hypothetical protein EST38_g8642 [Candolleomyces aberdarensis]|uniref:F-box domain-containing protein n=1 Tax=Candolleomyces aberdarensis TaxID=2316362 RepID=A0A4Q2DC50_9AGAR|nr:hypothetical protein EST38_g8642 [Candolleomyces aberdarensis]